MEIPDWLLEKHLEQNHLEESIIDAKEAVLNAIKTMVIDKMKNLCGIQELGNYKTAYLRFDHLVSNDLLPFAKKLKEKGQADNDTDFIVINSGILTELYSYGITKEQLPNLKALADYMGSGYHKSHGRMVLEISDEQLKTYFAEDDEQKQLQQ
jgi:hypothetical protein